MKRSFINSLRKSIGKIHLILGLLAGIIVIFSFTGAAIFVWDKELTNWYYHDCVYVDEVGAELLPPSELFATVESIYPEDEFRSIRVESDPQKNYVLSRRKKAEDPGWTYFSTLDYYEKIYINPYSGKIEGVVDMKRNWIYLSRRLHQNLLLHPEIGEALLGYAAIVMIIMAFTGLYLWWPRSWKMAKHSFKIAFTAPWKKVNWDVHSKGSFYTHLFILFFALTGLTWTYPAWRSTVYKMLGNHPEEIFDNPEPPQLVGLDQTEPLDMAYADALTKRNSWEYLNLKRPERDKNEGIISATLKHNDLQSGWYTTDQFTYHPETGAIYWQRPHEKKLLGEKWRNSNYYLHTGSIYGWPSKVLATFCALFFVSLPITGFIIWRTKRRPKKKFVSQKKKNKEKVELADV